MHINTLLAELEVELSQYKSAGLIDRASMYKWASNALKKFGQSICTLQEKVVEVKHGQALLNDDFRSLHFAVKCNPKSYYCSEESKPILQKSLMWKERIEQNTTWNSCDPCCKEVGESVITENVYLEGNILTFYYENPIPLRLGKHITNLFLANDCRNLMGGDCPYEITIQNTTLHANFTTGTIYMKYYGLPTDEQGLPIIPDTYRGELVNYIEIHLKRRLIEKLVLNGDDVNLANQLSYLSNQEKEAFKLAKSDINSSSLTTESYRKLAMLNRFNISKYELLLPSRF